MLCAMMHNAGMFTWVDGESYQGTWYMGLPHGLGIAEFASGAAYCGEWCLFVVFFSIDRKRNCTLGQRLQRGPTAGGAPSLSVPEFSPSTPGPTWSVGACPRPCTNAREHTPTGI